VVQETKIVDDQEEKPEQFVGYQEKNIEITR